jgi:type IV pilus assembly protein PilO
MKLHFSKREKMILLLLSLLLVLGVAFAQLVLLNPLQSDLEMKEQRVESQQKLLDALNNKNKSGNAETVTAEETREIQKKVPVKPMQEQFILDLEKAETISNSKITGMTFSAAGDTTIGASGTDQTQGATTTETETDPAAEEETTEGQQPAENPAANALKKLTVNLNVESPSYKELEKFIQSLESLKRIVIVEAINYSSAEEITTVDQKTEAITYSLTISAYYLPELNDLIAELPKIDAPAPANKDNPLSTFSDTTKAN